MQLDHMNISASLELLETVKDFYCDALGFRVGPRPEVPIPGYWLYPEGGDRAIIHLIESTMALIKKLASRCMAGFIQLGVGMQTNRMDAPD